MRAYQFALLRYRQSAAAGECVNVGVTLWIPETQQLLIRTNERFGRLSKFFVGSFDGQSFRQMVRAIHGRFTAIARELEQVDALRAAPEYFAEILNTVVPDDESCFQWSHVMGGITEDPVVRVDELFQEMVLRHEQRAERGRRDEDVIRHTVDQQLKAAGLSDKVRRDVPVETAEFSYTFHRGWMNGTLQVLEPISLDYLNASELIDKANTWSGRLYTLGRHVDFRMTGVVAPPADEGLRKAFDRAVRILNNAPRVRRIVVEDRVEEVLSEIQHDLESHAG